MSIQFFFLLLAALFTNPKPECKIINETPSNSLVWLSSDLGKSWQDVGDGLPVEKPASSLDIRNDKLFLSVGKNLYQNDAKNNPGSWKKQLSTTGDISNVFNTRSGTFLLTYPQGLIKIMSDGSSPQPKYQDMTEKFIFTMHVLKDGSVLLGTQSGVFKSSNDGKTWDHVYNLGAISDIVEIGDVLVSGGSLGLIKSTDGGNTWQESYYNGKQSQFTKISGKQIISLSKKIYEYQDSQSLLFPHGDNTYDLLMSNDAGKTWSNIDLNFDPSLNIIDVCTIGEDLYCSVTTGIFKSDDKGKSWKLLKPTDKDTPLKLITNGKSMYAVKTFFGC